MRNIDLFMKHFVWAMDGQAAINALAGYLAKLNGPCPIGHVGPCPQDCKSCWKHYLESEVSEQWKAVLKLTIEEDTITFDGDGMDQLTMKDLLDSVKVLVSAVKLMGAPDQLILASVVSGVKKGE